jgi:hypothetical protein
VLSAGHAGQLLAPGLAPRKRLLSGLTAFRTGPPIAPGRPSDSARADNGVFLSVSGAGGSFSVPLPAENQTATMTWAVPWAYINGLADADADA